MTAAAVALSLAVYVAGLVLLRTPARRAAGVVLAAAGGVGLAVSTLP